MNPIEWSIIGSTLVGLVVWIRGCIKRSNASIRLIFCQSPFPGSQYRLDWLRSQDAGNGYRCQVYKMEGWLCPALFKFFPRAPRHIYVRSEPK